MVRSIRTALVTGTARGVGQALARQLASDGHRVIGVDVVPHDDDALTMAITADLSRPEDCARIVETAGDVDMLANVAGLLRPMDIEEVTLEGFDLAIAVNLRATFLLCQGFAPQMAERGWGRIVNVSSVMARNGGQSSAPYAAAKAGVLALTKAFAARYASQGVTVNATAPAAVDTPLNDFVDEEGRRRITSNIPVGRFSTPEEQAVVIAFLLSEEAAYVTGVTVDVNGGWVMT